MFNYSFDNSILQNIQKYFNLGHDQIQESQIAKATSFQDGL